MKGLIFLGTSLTDLKQFPPPAKRAVGFELDKVQGGKESKDWKPMGSAGPGVREIRVHEAGEWRVLYVATFPEAVYVLHAFRKKTPKTSFLDIRLGRQRYKDLLSARRFNHEDQND